MKYFVDVVLINLWEKRKSIMTFSMAELWNVCYSFKTAFTISLYLTALLAFTLSSFVPVKYTLCWWYSKDITQQLSEDWTHMFNNQVKSNIIKEWCNSGEYKMEFDWKVTTFLLCCYGFFKEIRPSEPFLTEYLISNHTGVTENEVKNVKDWGF